MASGIRQVRLSRFFSCYAFDVAAVALPKHHARQSSNVAVKGQQGSRKLHLGRLCPSVSCQRRHFFPLVAVQREKVPTPFQSPQDSLSFEQRSGIE